LCVYEISDGLSKRIWILSKLYWNSKQYQSSSVRLYCDFNYMLKVSLLMYWSRVWFTSYETSVLVVVLKEEFLKLGIKRGLKNLISSIPVLLILRISAGFKTGVLGKVIFACCGTKVDV